MSDSPDDADFLPAIPRPVTARARWRSWAEIPVRIWMLSSIAIALLIGYFGVSNVGVGLADRRLSKSTSAKIVEIESGTNPNIAISSERRWVKVAYSDSHGNAIATEQRLETSRFDGRHVGDTIEIRIDPDSPQQWTDRTEPDSWSGGLAIVLLMLPLLAITLIMMLWRRRQILNLWRQGIAANAIVVDFKQSPLAPRSRVMRLIVDGEGNRKIRSIFCPSSAGAIAAGDSVVVLVASAHGSRALMARLYIE